MMATRERPRICPDAYDRLSKAAIYLACVDMIAIGLEKESDEVTDADVMREVNHHAECLRNAGWSSRSDRHRGTAEGETR